MNKPNFLIYVLIFVLILFSVPRNTKEVFNKTKHYRDTIIRYDTIEKRILELDTFLLTQYDTIIDSIIYPINEYNYKVIDSTLSASIKVQSPFKPKAVSLEYSLKSYKVRDSVYTVRPPPRQFFYGGELVVSPFASGAYITLGYQDRKKNIFTLSVGNIHKINTIKVGLLKKF